MASNLFFPLLLIVSLDSTTKSQAIAAASTAADEAADLPCVKELLPCQPYLHTAKPPPAQCCVPLLSAMQRKAACLCAVFYSDPILNALNLTQEEASRLPRSCGGHVPELSTCKNGGGSSGGPTLSPPTQAASAPPVKLSPTSNAPSSSKSNTGNIIKTAGLAILIGGTAFCYHAAFLLDIIIN